MPPLVICTVSNPGVYILLQSIKIYAPETPVFLFGKDNGEKAKAILPNIIYRENKATNFGDAYNEAIDCAFSAGYESVIVSNDDVVLNPNTLSLIREDSEILACADYKIGFLGARSDYVLHDQNIRFPVSKDKAIGLRWESEDFIRPTGVIAPIFALLNKEAWSVAKFPSTNWYSDNIICHDLQKAGYRHFVSRAYVHHAGSQTVGTDFEKCHEEPRAWIKEHRPDMYEAIYGND